jgi:hypothetical protein
LYLEEDACERRDNSLGKLGAKRELAEAVITVEIDDGIDAFYLDQDSENNSATVVDIGG